MRAPSTNPSAAAGDFDCWKMQPCPTWKCGELAGNPIHASSGSKLQREVDIASMGASGLMFARTFASGTYFDFTAGNAAGPSSYWRHTYQRRIVAISGNSEMIAAAQREDGNVKQFTAAGIELANTDGAGARLTRLTDAGGNLVGWRYSSGAGEIETYNTAGELLSITSRTGLAQTVTYSDAATPAAIAPRPGLPISVSDTFGRTLNLTYDSHARLATVTDPSGGITIYEYDGQSNPDKVTFPDLQSRSYVYENSSYPHFLTGIIDENSSRYSTYGYDSHGLAQSTELAMGVGRYVLSGRVALGLCGAKTYVTNPLNTTFLNQYTIAGGAAKQLQRYCSSCGGAFAIEQFSYDPNGNLASHTDFNYQKTCYASDLVRNLETKRVEGLLGNVDCTTSLSTPPTPTAANPARTISTQWHPDWSLEARRAEPKKIITWVYNGQPDPTSGGVAASCAPGSALLPDGKPIAVLCKKVEQATADATGASGFSATVTGSPRTWSWTYNQYGQVLTANGPRTDVTDTTTYTYYSDTAANHTLGDLYTVKDALGHITTYTSYDKNGRPLTIVDPNSLTTTLTYTPRGWLKTRQVGSELTTYDYDNVGQLKKVTAPDLSWIGYDYDPAHRLTDIYDNLGNRITYTLDNAGNRTREDVTDPTGNLARTQTRVYDALSRLQNIIQPE